MRIVIPPSHPVARPRAARHEGEHAVLDDLDVVVVAGPGAPWQLAALHAAVEADLGAGWRGGVYVVQDGVGERPARDARRALAAHHPLARRTLLALPRRLGATAAMDLGLDEATGEWAALLDVATRPGLGTLGTLLDELHEHPGALWAAAPVPGCAVVRRRAFLEIGAFDPALRDGQAVRDAAARAGTAGWELRTAADARARRELAGGAQRTARLRRPPGPTRRPWSRAALEAWLPRARRAAVRVDLG
ncbi:MAG TPA: hypothetical protein VFT50_05120 [Baekduia sp.]|nr:hypothetical protein [Baekduia sp.]